MIKKTILSLMISTTTYADITSSTSVRIPPYAHANSPAINASYHTYSITNQTDEERSYNICFNLNVCNEFPYYIQTKTECIRESVKPHDTHKSAHNMEFMTTMPLSRVQCTIFASTQITGPEYQISTDQKMMTFV